VASLGLLVRADDGYDDPFPFAGGIWSLPPDEEDTERLTRKIPIGFQIPAAPQLTELELSGWV
jgi:hypothetical protein